MFDPMTLLAAPFLSGALPMPGARGLAVLRARPFADFPVESLVCEQGMRPLHDALAAQGAAVAPRIDGAFPAAAAVLTRHRAENRANFARAWGLAQPGGAVLAVGAKTDGVESLQRDIRKLVDLDGVQPKNHGRVFWVARGEATPDIFAQWLAEAAPAPRVARPGGEPYVTAAGMFSWRETDPGSRLLAETLPPLKGVAADLGAGWGYLSDAILRSAAVTRLDLWEAEKTAIDCARRNIDDPRAAFHWADATGPDLPRGVYDWVISNPPFHEGRAVSLALGEGFLAAGARALAPKGALLIVANRTLPYEKPLEALFAKIEELALTPRYKILKASRPKPARR